MIKITKCHLLLFPVCALLLASLTTAEAGQDSYGAGQMTIEDVALQKDGAVRLTFTAMAETLWHCPGANAKTTKKGVELTFVRSRYKKRPEVDYPKDIVGKAGKQVSVITVPAKGSAIWWRDGKKLVKLCPKDQRK